ncbi:MAG: adenylate/guanylate cyclase domain-containing protein, partial [Gaiellaceae bacterium]
TLERQGRIDEAARFAAEAERTTRPDDIVSSAVWQGTLARVLARRGELAEAERLARAASAMAATTDMLTVRGDALLDLAAVLGAAGRAADRDDAVRTALALYERKGDVVDAARARELLAPASA